MYSNDYYYYVYILTNKKYGTLYTGITNDLEQRIREHKLKINKGKGFTAKYDLTKLVYYEVFDDVNEAIKREKQIKKYKRNWKFNLIAKNNLSWKDLSSSLGIEV